MKDKRREKMKRLRRDEKEREKIVNKGVDLTIKKLIIISVYALRDFGFGTKRMNAFLVRFWKVYLMLANGHVRIETLQNELEEDYNINVEGVIEDIKNYGKEENNT